MISALFGQARPSLPSLVVALGSAGLAYVWLEVDWVLTAAISVVLLVAGAIAYLIGDSYLNRDTPKAVAAERWLRSTVAAPVALAVFVGAGIIVLGIATAPAKDWSEQQKQLTAALAAALTTYLTTVFVKGADEADEGWVGKLVRDRFQTRLKGRFPPASIKVRDAVFDKTRGWDADNRKERVKEIDDYIKGNGEVLPRTGR